MAINPVEIRGAWTRGWALDRHTRSSEFLGYDEYGHERYETIRTELGELLYQLKYRKQETAGQVADVMAGFFGDKPETLARIDLVIPVLPSTSRAIQPVEVLAAEVAKRLKKPVLTNAVHKTRETSALKNIHDPEQRREALVGVFAVDQGQVKDRGVLLIDDLYRSGATANALSVALLTAGAARVYFLVATRTRSNR